MPGMVIAIDIHTVIYIIYRYNLYPYLWLHLGLLRWCRQMRRCNRSLKINNDAGRMESNIMKNERVNLMSPAQERCRQLQRILALCCYHLMTNVYCIRFTASVSAVFNAVQAERTRWVAALSVAVWNCSFTQMMIPNGCPHDSGLLQLANHSYMHICSSPSRWCIHSLCAKTSNVKMFIIGLRPRQAEFSYDSSSQVS